MVVKGKHPHLSIGAGERHDSSVEAFLGMTACHRKPMSQWDATPCRRTLPATGELVDAIAREAKERDQSWSAAARELLEDGGRMRRIPGIVFADGAAGRRAIIAGTKIDVWEVIATWRSGGEDETELAANYLLLSPYQRQAALAYYATYPDEIDERLAQEARWTPGASERNSLQRHGSDRSVFKAAA